MTSGKNIRWVRNFAVVALGLISAHAGFAQSPDPNGASVSSASASADGGPPKINPKPQQIPEPPGGKRVFGVLPNYRTVDESQVAGPLTNSQKFSIATKDSFDYPLILLAGGLAGIGQWSNQNPSFGQGVAGFSKRLVTSYGDQALGNMMTEGVFPTILHEDPRYYLRGTGTPSSRISYAVSRIFVTHTDSGKLRFNYSEWLGNAAATAISNAYYPDGRRVRMLSNSSSNAASTDWLRS
jgi:hypothetical protein